ncbi:MAG: hypothetical protein QW688_00390 [Thermoprotei archaeon]
MIRQHTLTSILLLVGFVIPFGGVHLSPYVGDVYNQPPTLTCNHTLYPANGPTNISAPNSVGGELLVAAYSRRVNDPSGYILFFSSQNTTVWWSQEPGTQNYAFKAGEGVAGYMSCLDGYSNYLIHFGSGQTHYEFNDSLGQLILVLMVVCTQSPPAQIPRVDGAPMSHAYNYSSSGLTLALYAGLFNVEPNNTVSIDTPTPHSYILVFSVSTNPYGEVVGTISPAYAHISVNGTPITTRDGLLNITLHYGVYEFNFSAPHYLNLSVIVIVYGGRTTPLSISLASLTQSRIRVLESILTRVVEALILGALCYLGWVSYKKFRA